MSTSADVTSRKTKSFCLRSCSGKRSIVRRRVRRQRKNAWLTATASIACSMPPDLCHPIAHNQEPRMTTGDYERGCLFGEKCGVPGTHYVSECFIPPVDRLTA